MDERGVDYGVLTGVGLVIAAAVVLLFVFSLLRSSQPANTAIALEAAASEVSGDVGVVASMTVPYKVERHYGFDGMSVSISADRVTASAGKDIFSRPLANRIIPGEYGENDTVLWNGTAGMRKYLNASFNATGTGDHPIDDDRSEELRRLMDRASRSTLIYPIVVSPGRPLAIEKTFVYTYNGSTHVTEATPYVLVYHG
jgi:hypothetical protein